MSNSAQIHPDRHPPRATLFATALIGILVGLACNEQSADIHAPAGGCYQLTTVDGGQALVTTDEAYTFQAAAGAAATPLRLQASGLGQVLLYAPDRSYLAALPAGGSTWQAARSRAFNDLRIDYPETESPAEWALESVGKGAGVYWLRHLRANRYLGTQGLADEGTRTAIRLVAAQRCADYPELTLDANGSPRSTPWPNGDVYGFADIHSHLFTNEGFGGGGVFHGAPWHPLGVEHALTDCTEWHGVNGERDAVDFFLSGGSQIDADTLIPIFTTGKVQQFNHATTGYPGFTSWPDARKSKTHQAQYHRWLERAWMAGLRLVLQHATGNSALCELMVGLETQQAPYTCNDMLSVDHTLEAVRGLEAYLDAQAGGPGKGWLRIVESPAQARTVVNQGKLAMVLGIEISNVFDCFLTPPKGMPDCDLEHIQAEVQEYYDKGVRVVFPVHKYDNGFSAGDGASGAIEIGNVLNSGLPNDKVDDCPDFKHNLDSGPIVFKGLNEARDSYFAEPDYDMSDLASSPIRTMAPLIAPLTTGDMPGDFCQARGLTQQGKDLLGELISRGMVIDLAHLPKRATLDAFEILDAARYPAISTHGLKYDGRIYTYGGLSDTDFADCAVTGQTDTMGDPFRQAAAEIQAANGLPAQPFAFDLNGFANVRGPRFGPNSSCPQPQANPVEYPFRSFAGGVTFTRPRMGTRTIDFNTEGVLHIGLLPELIEDARRDGMSDTDLEPLFRTAEAFIRTWEATEAAAQ